jgi:hypothetical protein
LPLNTTMEKLFAEVPNASGTLDDYIKNMETSQEEVAAEFSADEEIGE